MRFSPSSLADFPAAGFDDILDVRSPQEFAEDHVPGAVNLPVLDDAERAEIGTIYMQQSRFLARRRGAALVARNAARHLMGYLADKGPGYRPLVYCWRGGQRSGSFATILAQIGWQVSVLDGGWRGYRRLVAATLYDTAVPAPLWVLDGNTGTAKTALLHRLAALGVQVIDLEGLAHHRGSLFGALPGGQPSQKAFESALAAQIAVLDPARPLIVEAESSKIGARNLPPALWRAMCAAPRLEIEAPLAARATFLARAYADLVADGAALARVLDRLRPYHAASDIADWQAMGQRGDFPALAAALMAAHYDPRYAKSRARSAAAPAEVFATPSLDDPALDALAARLAARLSAG